MEEIPHIKKLRISRIIVETDDAKTFVLEPLEDWKPSYHAGQFLTLVFYTKHGEKRRSYSISSSPELGEPLSITVKKVSNGEFSRLLVHYAQEGDILYTSGINGLFSLPEKAQETEQYFFLAAGSGITPCFSLIKTVLETTKSKIILIYSNKSENDTIFCEQLKMLESQHEDRFTIRFLFSDIFDIYQRRLSKWLLDKFLDEYLLSNGDSTLFYICGPFEYMQMITITLLIRVPAQHIFKENFDSLPRVHKLRPPDTEAHVVTIHFHGKIHQLNVQYPKSILSVAKANNLGLPYSCEAGRCGSCVATCTSGKVWMAYNEVLTEEEVKKGRVLVCQSYPIDGNAEIKF